MYTGTSKSVKLHIYTSKIHVENIVEYFNYYSKPAEKVRKKKIPIPNWYEICLPTLSGLQASLVSCYQALECCFIVVILSLKDLKVTKIVNYLSSGIDQ